MKIRLPKWLVVPFIVLMEKPVYAYDVFPALGIMEDVAHEIKYEKSPDRLKLPADTERDGVGDCADMSLLMLKRMEDEGLTGGELSFWDHPTLGSHAVVEYQGRLYDPANDRLWNPGPGWVYRTNEDYTRALWLAREE
jgi:hypothetical protein